MTMTEPLQLLPPKGKALNNTIKQIVYYIKDMTILYNYLYFVKATCFGLSLDHLQDNVLK
jgi:hypothetical protein